MIILKSVAPHAPEMEVLVPVQAAAITALLPLVRLVSGPSTDLVKIELALSQNLTN